MQELLISDISRLIGKKLHADNNVTATQLQRKPNQHYLEEQLDVVFHD